MNEEMLTPKEVASIPKLSHVTVYRLLKTGEIPNVRIGSSFRIKRSDVERITGG